VFKSAKSTKLLRHDGRLLLDEFLRMAKGVEVDCHPACVDHGVEAVVRVVKWLVEVGETVGCALFRFNVASAILAELRECFRLILWIYAARWQPLWVFL